MKNNLKMMMIMNDQKNKCQPKMNETPVCFDRNESNDYSFNLN